MNDYLQTFGVITLVGSIPIAAQMGLEAQSSIFTFVGLFNNNRPKEIGYLFIETKTLGGSIPSISSGGPGTAILDFQLCRFLISNRC